MTFHFNRTYFVSDSNELVRIVPGVIQHTSRPNQCLAYYIDRSKKNEEEVTIKQQIDSEKPLDVSDLQTDASGQV